MKVLKEESQDQGQTFDQLKEQIKSLNCELLKERITRIDFQVQLLTHYRQRCQQELNQALAGAEDCHSPEGSHA